MAELVDALDSKSSVCEDVRVRVPLPAPSAWQTESLSGDCQPKKSERVIDLGIMLCLGVSVQLLTKWEYKMKLLPTLIAAVFAVSTFTAVAAPAGTDAPAPRKLTAQQEKMKSCNITAKEKAPQGG